MEETQNTFLEQPEVLDLYDCFTPLECDPKDTRTVEEKIIAGDEELPPGFKIVGNSVVEKTKSELYLEGILSKEDYDKMNRSKRNELLRETDKYVLSDYPISEDKRTKVLEYREYLRHLPENPAWPDVDIKGLDIK